MVIPNVKIGDWSILGAGSVAAKSLPPDVTAVGAPEKIIKIRKKVGTAEIMVNK